MTSEEATLVDRLKSTPNGKPIVFPSLLPAFSKDGMQGVIVERDGDKFWQLELYWLSVRVAKVTAEVHEGNLILEVL